MATYSFKCSRCGKVAELEKPMSEGPPDPFLCECSGEMCRIFTPINFRVNRHKHRGGAEIVERAREVESRLKPEVVNKYPSVANT